MMTEWIDPLAAIALQHLWQSAMLFLLAVAMFHLFPLKASTRSLVWLVLLGMAALAPLAVFAPVPAEALAALPAPAAHALAALPAAALAPATVAPQLPAAASSSDMAEALAMLKPAVVLAWLLGVLWHLTQVARGWRAAVLLQRGADHSPRLEQLVRRELPRGTSIKLSDQIAGPMVVGLSHACILVPRTLSDELSEPVLRDILHHEIAHIRRRDLWLSLVQQVLTALYWWSPALRLIGTRLDLAREMACDEHAAAHTGAGKAYAQSLLASIERMTTLRQPPVMAHAMFSSGSGIGQRVNSLLRLDQKGRHRARRFSTLAWGAVMAAAVTVTFAATPRMPGATSARAADNQDSGPAQRLIAAAKAGNLPLVEQLLVNGQSADAGVDTVGTPLIAAAGAGQLAVVEALLAKRAAIDLGWPGDGNPLIAAARNGHLQVVERLVAAGANVNANHVYDETPLINAVRAGQLQVVAHLVEHGADVNLGVYADGDRARWRTPLNQARDGAVRDFLVSMGAK